MCKSNVRRLALRTKCAQYKKRVQYLEDLSFMAGGMISAPCFCCGYNGPSYFNPTVHSCASRHDKLYVDSEE